MNATEFVDEELAPLRACIETMWAMHQEIVDLRAQVTEQDARLILLEAA